MTYSHILSFHDRVRQDATSQDITILSSEQFDRSQQKLTPYIELIGYEVEQMRARLDILIQEKRQQYRGKYDSDSVLGLYPLSQCRYIRDQVLHILRSNNRDPRCEGLQAIRRYNKTSAAVFEPIWGIQHETYFQNAIQLGGYCIDAAGDTLDISAPKVSILPMHECGIRNIADFTDYAQIAETYGGYDMYPNIYIPQLAPLFPSIAICEDGTMRFEGGGPSVLSKNILSSGSDVGRFQHAYDFILKSSYADKRLPSAYVDELFRIFTILRSIGSPIKNLCEFEEDGCPLMTQTALYQRAEDPNISQYYEFSYSQLVKPINEYRFKPLS